jgi:glycosyltransferase involved in cell wall biosynthesis
MTRKVWLSWELNSRSGWGILGLNLFFHWASHTDITPIMASTITNNDLSCVDPLRLSLVSNAITASNDFSDNIARTPGTRIEFDGTVIDPVSHADKSTRIFGSRNIGRCIFENADVSTLKLDKFDSLLCASNWNADLLRKQTGREVNVIFEGIDPSLFCPGPRSGIRDPAKFYIFSGGKVEQRKGQDLVLRAFREFAKRHPNAVLVTAWHSPWAKISAGFQGTLDASLELDHRGLVNVKKWVADNGVDPSRVVEVFSTANQLMPTLLREMDVALQPSRAEPCTNLPAMEAMACGLPVIVAENTGMKDLITEDNCIRLSKQDAVPQRVPHYSTAGWGESNVDEIIEALEMLYADRKRREAIGAAGARWIREHRTWQIHAAKLKDLVLSSN